MALLISSSASCGSTAHVGGDAKNGFWQGSSATMVARELGDTECHVLRMTATMALPGVPWQCSKVSKAWQAVTRHHSHLKKNYFGAGIWEQIQQEGQEKRGGLDYPTLSFSVTGRAAITAVCPDCGRVGSGASSPPFLCPPPPSRSGKVGSLELVQLCKQDHRGEQTASHIRQLKEKSQVLLSLFNLQDQYLCNIHVIGLNICYRIKYFCTALVTSVAASAWGCW